MGSLLSLGGAFVALDRRVAHGCRRPRLAGAIGLAGAVLLASSGTQRARYRPRRMTAADWLVALATLAAPIAMAVCSLAGANSLFWYTSPLRWPTLDFVPALALLPLLIPVMTRTPMTVRAPVTPAQGGRGVSAISIAGVSFEYPDAERAALHGADLEVEPGELLLVIGASGSGKSTLLRTVNGLVPHASGGKFAGDVVVFGRSTRTHHPRELADVVGFVAQDPEAQFVVDHVERDIAFVLENLGFSPEAMRRRVEEVLDALGIAHLRDRDPATLSGGERQRCAIAGALAASPSALVLDEPTSQLDPQGADDVLAALTRLNHDLGTTVVLAEHRLERAAPLADRAVVVADGRVGVPDRPGAHARRVPGCAERHPLGPGAGVGPATADRARRARVRRPHCGRASPARRPACGQPRSRDVARTGRPRRARRPRGAPRRRSHRPPG